MRVRVHRESLVTDVSRTRPSSNLRFSCVSAAVSGKVWRWPHFSSLTDCFPFKLMRPSQEKVLDQTEGLPDLKKVIILEALVGISKSAITAALPRNLGSAHILATTRQLQDRYADDFGFPVVKGKSDFQCRIPARTGKLLPRCKDRCEVETGSSKIARTTSISRSTKVT